MAIIENEPRENAPADNHGILAFLLLCIIAATIGVLLTPPPAGASTVSGRSHRVACARTEDSYLTTCGAHRTRLDYHDGAWWTPAAHVSGSQQAGRALPEWFRAYRTSRHANGHPCLLVGAEFHPHRTGIVCANGTAHVLGNVHRGARVVAMPRWFHWAGSERDSVIQVWAGTGDTSLAVGDDAYMSTS